MGGWARGCRARALELLHSEALAAGDERIGALAELERIVHAQLTGVDVESVRAAAGRVIASSATDGDDATIALAWRRISPRTDVPASTRLPRRRHAVRRACSSCRRQPGRSARRRRPLQQPSLRPDPRERGPLRVPRAPRARYEPNPPGRCDGRDVRIAGRWSATSTRHKTSYRAAAAILEELGLDLARAALTQIGIPLELLAGDPIAAEQEATKGAEIYARFTWFALPAPLIAEALLAQGPHHDAEDALAGVTAESGPEGVQWRVHLRMARLDLRRRGNVSRTLSC